MGWKIGGWGGSVSDSRVSVCVCVCVCVCDVLDADTVLHHEHRIRVQHRVQTMCNREHGALGETFTNDLCVRHDVQKVRAKQARVMSMISILLSVTSGQDKQTRYESKQTTKTSNTNKKCKNSSNDEALSC
jgi:hypothetical protein